MRILTIAANTFIEVIRQPIFLIILGVSLLLILLSPYLTIFALLANQMLVKDMTMATVLLTGLLLSAFSASNVIYKEIENRTILTVITKPVKRSSFIIGKYLGLLLALFVAQYLLSLVLIQTIRTEITEAAYSKSDYPVLFGYLFAIFFTLIMAAFANFFYEKPFNSSAVLLAIPFFSLIFCLLCVIGHDWSIQPILATLDYQILIATFLIFLATALLTAIAVASSTRLSPIATLILCLTIFLLGLFSDYLFGRNAQNSVVANILYKIVPNIQIYWVMDAILDERTIPLSYLKYILSYTISFVLGILAIAMALFLDRETR